VEKVLFDTYFRDTPFDEIRYIFDLLGIGHRHKGVDIGMGGGVVCAVGHLKGACMTGIDCDGVMYKVAKEAWDDFEGRISRKTSHDPFYLGDGLKFLIGDFDMVWSYLMADKQPKVLEKFDREAKRGSRLVLRYPTPECRDMSKKDSLEQISSGDLDESFLILGKR
jgi:hypothetical protein